MYYRPEFSAFNTPPSKSRTVRRARLFAGGTYFRTRTPALQGNKISVQLIELADGTGKLIVTNHNTLIAENITGPVLTTILVQQLDWNERYIIRSAGSKFNISSQLGTDPEIIVGPFSFSQLLHIPNKLSAKMTQLPEFTSASTVVFSARARSYDLVKKTVTSEPTIVAGVVTNPGSTSSGWDPDALRAAVNASDPWIEMLARSGPVVETPGTQPKPLKVKFDEQDDEIDDMFLSAFPDTYMTGGDGLPDFPVESAMKTDPTSFMIHTSASEQQNGVIQASYDLYEWVGTSAADGSWKQYS